MSIWTPGQKDEDKDFLVEFKEIINAFIELAKEQGYEDYREFLMNYFDKWDYEEAITMFFFDWIAAVNQAELKPDGQSRWDENSTFEEWLALQKQRALEQLEKLYEERKNKKPSFQDLAKWIEESDGNFKPAAPKVGETPEDIMYDFYEGVIRKTLETIEKFEKGLIRPKERLAAEEDYGIRLL